MSSHFTSMLPKVHVEADFLHFEDNEKLIIESLDAQQTYRASTVSGYDDDGALTHKVVNENSRKSALRKLSKTFRSIFTNKIQGKLEVIQSEIGVTFPQDPIFEIEAVHSGDGAFFRRHIDTARGHKGSNRLISAVYYYSQTPAKFTGGELVLYSLDGTSSTAVQPANNTMVFFSSIFPHEVLPVSVPSHRFEDGRFSVNCWIHKSV